MEQLKDQTSTQSNNFRLKIIEIMELDDTLRVLNPKEREVTYGIGSRSLKVKVRFIYCVQ